ncbi:cupin domain-containing protein [Rhodobacteraceae bacterium W635]|uniref:cupin domain-containing protein n=1 Tax=Nioella halotolerans TaxID=2303578 RepID=UPI000E3C9DBB|nr:cupin domain-containing protein [Rhodobacteraceae bacterium W635]
MPRIDLSKLETRTGSIYPAPYDVEMAGRSSLRVGDAGGLTQFGANIVLLAPGAKSSLRHWHEQQDEFVMITQGACTLVDDHGETPMGVGECAAFKAGDPNGHHFINHTDDETRFLVIGTRTETETGWYSDVDLKISVDATGFTFTRKDGTPLKGDEK